MANFSVQITMSQTTVGTLKNQGFSLYGFKAVQTSQGGGAPLVWVTASGNDLLPVVEIDWMESYQSFISTSKTINANTVIHASNSANCDLGQTTKVDKNGLLTVFNGGAPHAITLDNAGSSNAWTCGISQKLADGTSAPMCAFPLNGQGVDIIAPIEKVLLFFATQPVNTGTVIEQALGQGVLLDLTANPNLTVHYDINAGWDFGGQSFGTVVPADSDIISLLIVHNAALKLAA